MVTPAVMRASAVAVAEVLELVAMEETSPSVEAVATSVAAMSVEDSSDLR